MNRYLRRGIQLSTRPYNPIGDHAMQQAKRSLLILMLCLMAALPAYAQDATEEATTEATSEATQESTAEVVEATAEATIEATQEVTAEVVEATAEATPEATPTPEVNEAAAEGISTLILLAGLGAVAVVGGLALMRERSRRS
jgi:hypothetical protein